jgi:hypothetical protein
LAEAGRVKARDSEKIAALDRLFLADEAPHGGFTF